MTKKIKEALREFEELLESIPLLSNVGERQTQTGADVDSWKEVYKFIAKQNKWLNFKNRISNNISEIAYGIGMPDEVYRLISQLIQKKITTSLADFVEPELFNGAAPSGQILYHVKWDLSVIAGEIILSKETKDYPEFFTEMLLPWYQKGHFPCAWEGKMISQSWAGKSLDDLPMGTVRVF